MAPVLLLLVIAPLVAEFLIGCVTLASLPSLVLFIPLYGGGDHRHKVAASPWLG
jgi:hypothetical protein